MVKPEKAVTKDMLVGMEVIDADGHTVGAVKDVAFMVGKMGISLFVESKKGEGKNVTWEEVQAVGDYIVLKPTLEQPQVPQACPVCGGPVTFIPQYQKWYCYRDRRYV